MRGWPIVWVALVGVLFFAPADAVADGGAFKGVNLSSLRPVPQREQRAAILHRDGVEKLIVAINIDLEDQEKGLWILPVLGTPGRTSLDVLDAFPQFSGRDLRRRAGLAIENLSGLMRANQIYPFVWWFLFAPALGGAQAEIGAVSVHEQIDRHGIHAETITAESLDALSKYLEGKGAVVEGDSLGAFGPYLSGDYVLVLAWIRSREELLEHFPELRPGGSATTERWPCLYVEFPTERAYYPLRPTSLYGDAPIGIYIYVLGCVRPVADEPGWAEEHFGVAYCKQDEFGTGTPQKFADRLGDGPMLYTVTYAYWLKADELTQDLWFEPFEPPFLPYAEVVVALSHPLVFVLTYVALAAALSYVSAGISALLVYGKWRPYARRGVWNVLTLIGLGYAIAKYRQREVGEKWGLVPFLLVFTVLYTVLVFAARAALLAPLG